MVNDSTIIYGFVLLFVIIGVLTPFINAEFGGDAPENQIGAVTNKESDASPVTAISIVFSVLKMFFWSFGDIPLWFELIFFEPMRIIFYFIVVRNFVPTLGAG